MDRNVRNAGKGRKYEVSHPARGAWIEIMTMNLVALDKASHPARGAWIEIR